MSGESAGKGDSPRPITITADEWARNWRRIFKEQGKNKNGTLPGKRDKKQKG